MNGKTIKSIFWVTLSNVVSKVFSLLSIPLFLRMMTPDDIGYFANVNSWLVFIVIIFSYRLTTTLSLAKIKYDYDYDNYAGNLLIIGLFFSSSMALIVINNIELFENIFLIEKTYIYMLIIYASFIPAQESYFIKCKFEYEYKKIVINQIVVTIAPLFVSLFAVYIGSNPLSDRIYSFFISSTLFNIFYFIKQILKVKKIEKKYLKFMFISATPMIWNTFGSVILSLSDKILITRIIDTEATAQYSVGYTLTTIVSMMSLSIMSAIKPWLISQNKINNIENIRKQMKELNNLFISIMIIVTIMSPELLYLLGGSYYLQAKSMLPAIMISYVIYFIVSQYIEMQYLSGEIKHVALGTILASIINVILNVLLLPIYGYIIAATTTLIGYLFMYIYYQIVSNKLKLNWYNNNHNNSCIIAMVCSIPLILTLYNYSIIRYIVAIVIIILTIIKYRYYINIFKIYDKK